MFVVLGCGSDRCPFKLVRTRTTLDQINHKGRLWPTRQVLTILGDFRRAFGFEPGGIKLHHRVTKAKKSRMKPTAPSGDATKM